MTNKKKRIKIAILGFFIFIIPLIFLCHNLKREYLFYKDRIEEDLREKLLDTAEKIEENLEPYNYLKSEFNKIHAKLFPDISNEIVDKILDSNFEKQLYTKDTFNKLLNLTKERFDPIIITFGNNQIKDIFAYYSPELERNLNNEDKDDQSNTVDNKTHFLYIKTYFDLKKISSKYYNYFHSNPEFSNFNRKITYIKSKDNSDLLKICYKYISRFNAYNTNTPLYTDYFKKQVLYNILKFTISNKKIYGFYSIIIPQSNVIPSQILESALLSNNNNNEVKIELVENNNTSEIKVTNNGLNYRLNFPVIFKDQVNSFKRLRGIDQSNILQKQIKLSINYPKEYNNLKTINSYKEIISILATLIYFLISIILISRWELIRLSLINKLIIVLSIIVLLPIFGLGLLNIIISRNFNNLVDINSSKSLHNFLENYNLLDKENFLRRLAFNFEIKRNTKNACFNSDTNNIVKSNIYPQKYKKEYRENLFNYTDDLYVVSENEDCFCFNKKGINVEKKNTSNTDKLFNKNHLLKYLNNLNLIKNKKTNKSETLSLYLMEELVNPQIEEKTFSQESIPLRDIISTRELDSTSYFLSKDKNNINYIFYNKLSGNSTRSYSFLKKYSDTNLFWYKPKIRNTSRANLAITLRNNVENSDKLLFPTINIYNNEFIELINKMINYKDSGNEKIQKNHSSIIKEWIYNENNAFVILGITETNHNNMLSFITTMIFPVILAYAIILLVLISKFIALFFNIPINIYKEGIEKLRNNDFGTTIEAFSKDEFNNITNAFNEMSIAINQKEQIKRFVSDRLVQSVESNEIPEAGDGKQEKVTILSSDIRNFTGISEKNEPSSIIEMLNSYFTRMQQAITENGGIIDKYIGDAIQAVFYDEPNKDNQVIRASKAALSMKKALIEFNKEREAKGLFTIENGIGIATDIAIIGTIGTSKGRKDFSVNGDVINRASELEAKTKETESKILLSKKSLEEIYTKKPLIEEGKPRSGRGGDLTRVKPNSMNKPLSQENWIATQSSTARNDGSNSNNDNDNKTNHTLYQSHLVFKIFDEDSVELIDVRE